MIILYLLLKNKIKTLPTTKLNSSPDKRPLSSSRSLFKVLPSSFLSPTRSKGLLLSGCGTVKMQHQVHSVLQAVFLLYTQTAPGRGWWKHQASTPQDWHPKGRVTAVAALSHEETSMAISVQFKNLPKTLFGCCHSFFWTFTFCCLVADRWWV